MYYIDSPAKNNTGDYMKKKKDKIDMELSVKSVYGQPETAEEQLRKYGTYEIQPTNDGGEDAPEIAQGLAKNQRIPLSSENDDI